MQNCRLVSKVNFKHFQNANVKKSFVSDIQKILDENSGKFFFFSYSLSMVTYFSKLGVEHLDEVEEHGYSVYGSVWAVSDPRILHARFIIGETLFRE